MSIHRLPSERVTVSTIESRAMERAQSLADVGAIEYEQLIEGAAADDGMGRDPLEILLELEDSLTD